MRATRIGAGWSAQASDRAGAVWLVSYPPGPVNAVTASASVQLISTAGKPLSRSYRLPAGYALDRGVGSYLLLDRITAKQPKRPYASELWDPRTGLVIRRFDDVSAAGPEQIAWSPACAGCRLQVLNVSTGKTVTTPIPGGQASGGIIGLFSDDGRLLAVQLPQRRDRRVRHRKPRSHRDTGDRTWRFTR